MPLQSARTPWLHRLAPLAVITLATLTAAVSAAEPAKLKAPSSEPSVVSSEPLPWDALLYHELMGGIPAGPSFGKRIQPSCPQIPTLNGPGVLCEDFDTDRNGVIGFQFSRLPIGVDPDDPLRAIGDPDDDVLGFAIGTGPSPTGTAAATCPSDVGFPACATPVAEENDWHLHSLTEDVDSTYDPIDELLNGAPHGGKAHSGTRSMHWGRHVYTATTLGDVLRFRQVSAFVLDSDGRNDPAVPGIVPGPASTLEFWHIISVPDEENFGLGFISEGLSFGGGQAQISLLGADGKFERWRRLTPSFNGHDSSVEGVTICSFDPGDDQMLPNDLTMCDPAPVWAEMGDVFGTDATCTTDTNFNDPLHNDCGDISCEPGPGCTENGSLGPGVWARSAFDLSPFAGRVARLRWIGMMDGGWFFGQSRSALEEESGGFGYWVYSDLDDGWYLDDIVLTDLRDRPHPALQRRPITPENP